MNDLLALELVRQFASIVYSLAVLVFAFLGPLAALNGIKAYCAAWTSKNRGNGQSR